MPETVKYLKDLGIIRVDSFGETSINDWKISMEEVFKINNNKGSSLVLVDSREQNASPNTTELFDFGSKLPGEFRFAVVISDKTIDDHSFLETVGKNRGKQIQLFLKIEEAIDWLKDNA